MNGLLELCPICKKNSLKSQVDKYATVHSCSDCGLFKVKYFQCCNNDHIENVIYYQKDDRKTIREQCTNCGKLLNTPAISFSKVNQEQTRLYNERLADERKEEIQEIKAYYDSLIKGNYGRIRYNTYESYYFTREWKELRQRVFQRDNFKCVQCGGKAEQAHHKHYKNFRNEQLEDLVSLCASCHNAIHEKIPANNEQ